MAGGIFVSYRRSDGAYVAGRLRDDLAEHLGEDVLVFRDIESLPLGPYPEELAEALRTCDVMLVVIGARWLSATDADGNRRLDQPDDWVRQEIAAALRQQKLVVPLLVEEASLPSPSELPDDLAALSLQQAVEVPDDQWDHQLSLLVEQLRVVLGLPRGLRVFTGPWVGADAPVRLTVEKVEARPDAMRLFLVVDNTTTEDVVILYPMELQLTDDTGHRYQPAPGDDWPIEFPPGLGHRGVMDIGERLQPGAEILTACWVEVLGTWAVDLLYVDVDLRHPPGRPRPERP